MAKYEDVVNLALRRSLFYPGSEIYANAPAGLYDFGPVGATIRRKIVETWRKHLVQREEMLEIDGALIMPEDVFKASGHLTNFNDPVTQCKKCNTIHRADKLLEEKTKEQYREAMPVEELTAALRKHKLACPNCKGDLLDVRQFNMMVKADVGVSAKASCYLRPETCQTIFTNWQRMAKTMRIKLPKGIAQHGKVFRNEISPRQTLLRQVEFSQMEAEIFFEADKIDDVERWDEVKNYPLRIMKAGSNSVEDITCADLLAKGITTGKLIAYYIARTQQLMERLGIPASKMRFRQLDDTERAFYAKEAFDLEVETSLGWLELAANNYRTDYDLLGHQKGSQKDLQFCTPEGKKFIPHIWEISIGLDRTFYTVLELCYRSEGERTWLSLPPAIAPLTAGIFPLLSNKPELTSKARELFETLRDCYEVQLDETGSIGKRYARMDEIGVPWCITIDFDSLNNNDVTIRARDSSAQKRVKIDALKDELYQLVTGKITL
ncbi:glycine--tRNA ligase [Candidatus Woesearchaeota archaeon]|nr:MAG: glycine--tRNA ligase [Candidatus Woesearchaeota archaeon]